jgi:sugar/nucleoside kinase (ribokinase family)
MTPSIDVVVAGHICLDLIPRFASAGEFSELFRPGKLTQMDGLTLSTGGPVSNTGIGLGILGMRAELMGKVGDDDLSGTLLGLLAQRGLEKSMVRVPGEQTSYTVVLAPPNIDRMFLHCPGANNTYGPEDVNLDVVGRAKIFHLGYPPLMRNLYANDGARLADIFRRVKQTHPHVVTSLDMSLPDPASESGRVEWRRVLEASLPGVDLFLPSAEESLFMLDRPRFLAMRDEALGTHVELLDFIGADLISRLARELRAMGPKIVNIKCGHRGIYTRTADTAALGALAPMTDTQRVSWADRELWHAAFHVENMGSATGSGDSSIAGFLAAFLRGLPVEEALKMSNAVGGCNVTALDALSGLKSWDETAALVAAGWPNKPPHIAAPGWSERIPGRLWVGPADRTA